MAELKYPENQKIIDRMEEEINCAFGNNAWSELTSQDRPNGNMDNKELSCSTYKLMRKFDSLTNNKMGKQIFSNVRHALKRSDFEWARKSFLEYNDIDQFAEAVMQDSINQLRHCMLNNELFYGQPITKEVFEYAQNVKDLFYGKRDGNCITATAIPFMVKDWLSASDYQMKRYHACHCQFAKKSILSDKTTVSKTLCYCSLGHTKAFWEAALDTDLDGDVLMSALNGDITCKFIIFLPDKIVDRYVNTTIQQ